MPCGIMELLTCWWTSCCSARVRKLWEMIPLYIFWSIWWERNSRSSEGKEQNLMELKGMVLPTLMDWANATGVGSLFSPLDFLNYCIAWACSVVWATYTPCVLGSSLFCNKIFIYWSKKKKKKNRLWPSLLYRQKSRKNTAWSFLEARWVKLNVGWFEG